MMRITFLMCVLLFVPPLLFAQSKTTQKLEERYKDSFKLFFYNNTLRMINQQGDPEFDELIKGIEKMKFLIIHKKGASIDYKSVVSEYKKESFEAIMTSRHQGKSFDIFVQQEAEKKPKSMLVLVNDDDNFFVLDIKGYIPFDKVTKLYSVLDEGSDVSRRVQQFISDDDEKNIKEEKATK